MEATANKEVAVLDKFPEKINDIKQAIDNLAVTQTKVKELKEKYSGVTIIDENDEEGYKLAREAKSILVKTRTSSVDDRKVALKPIDELRDNVYAEFIAVETELKEIELPITSRIKEIDDIEKQRKEAEKLAAEQKINDRINELLSKGMIFMDGYYVISSPELGISETSIGVVDIRTMSDDLYNNFLKMVKEKSSKITAEKERIALIEKKAAEEKEAAAKKEREEFEAQKKLMEEQQAAIKKQQDELKAQQDKLESGKRDAEKKLREIEEKERIAKSQEEEKRWRNRLSQMNDIGFNGQFAFVRGGDEDKSVITYEQLISFTDEQFNLIKDKFNKEEAERQEKKRIEEQQKKDLEIKAAKEKADELEKERLAGLSDKQKMQEYIDALYNVPVPPVTTKTWKAKVAMVRDMINDNRPI